MYNIYCINKLLYGTTQYFVVVQLVFISIQATLISQRALQIDPP